MTANGRRRPSAWALLLVATPFLAGFYLWLPTAGNARVIVYPAYGLLAALAITLVVLRFHPARRRAWVAVATGLALLTSGDIVYSAMALVDPNVPYPSYADLSYLAGYVVLPLGALGLIRGRTTDADRTALVDAAIVTAGAAAVFWLVIILPSLSGASDPLALAVSVAYPLMDLMLVLVGARALLDGAARPRFLQILVAGIALYLVSDVVYAKALLDGTYVYGDVVDVGWIVGVQLMAVAALHPSARDVVVATPQTEVRLSRTRLAVLAVAAMLAPALLVLQPSPVPELAVFGLVGAWTLLFGLVLIRMATTVDALGASLIHRRRLQDDLAYQATHDVLTRLANRALFETRLEAAVARDAERTGVVFIDLDDFKAVNDTLGHPTGDELLRTLASRIRRELRSTDIGARIGGDEFAILVEDCPDEATLRSLAERVLAVIRAPVALAGRHLVTHASAGIAFGAPGASGVDLMRDADVAMYQAKVNGKDQVERHEPRMTEAIVRTYELRTELRAAFEARSFTLEYQPLVDIPTRAIVAGEALVRWRHPERGTVLPTEFIGIAEASGLIHDLGRWMLREASLAAVRWPPLPNGRARNLAMNLSAAQLLEPHFADVVAETLRETGLDPKRLTFELADAALLDVDAATAALQRVSDLGVSLALDDFGIGHSALSHLVDLPFDTVKVDQSFVAGMADNEQVEAMLDGILGLCRSLGVLVIAEGIETEAQLTRLDRLGCPVGQGSLFAEPMPLPAFEALIATSAPRNGPFAPDGGVSVSPASERNGGLRKVLIGPAGG